jgi:hypothetical protein
VGCGVIYQSTRITLRQHRFEVGIAAVAAIVVGTAAIWINARLLGLKVPADCFEAWIQSGGGAGQECDRLVDSFAQISGDEAGRILAAMAILPLLAGLLGGVPIVGREIEAHTAQTAWSLSASRRRWFARQVLPIALVLGGTVTYAALAAAALEETRAMLLGFNFGDIGLYGPIVIARAFAALGVGLVAGAAIGRTLPAFIAGVLLSAALLVGASVLQTAWVNAQPQVVFDQADVDAPGFQNLIREQAWRAPDGRILLLADALALAPAGHADPYAWLTDSGYEVVQLGITADQAKGWELVEAAGFAVVGLTLVGVTVGIVDRRRPT